MRVQGVIKATAFQKESLAATIYWAVTTFQAFSKHPHFISAAVLGGQDRVFPNLKKGSSESLRNFVEVQS